VTEPVPPTSRPGAVLVVDFGAQYAQLIARRVREADCYSEIVPHTMPAADMLAKEPAAIILSGGPSSVYADGAPALEEAVVTAGVPVLGICYGFQVMARALGGSVERTGRREYGQTTARLRVEGSTLFDGQPTDQVVWMSHGDAVSGAPAGCTVTADTPGAPVAAFEDDERRLYGVQWHPEVLHSAHGQQVLVNFLTRGARIRPSWTSENVADELVEQIRAQVGEDRVICGLSGGVDSSVAAALVNRAVGDQLTCVFVDHGLLRQGEAEQVEQDFVEATGVDLVVVDARERFLSALAGVSDPEEKRKIIGREFIRVFEQAARDIVHAHEGTGPDGDRLHDHPVKWLVQGTLYPDVVESGGGTGTANIKSHHNVGGLPEDLQFQLIEPLRTLFKDEVRQVGLELGVPEAIVWRQPFPGPGLGIRIVGEVTAERLDILRRADAIAREELTAARLDRDIWQCPVVLLADVRSVGVQGDGRTYGHPVVLRPVSSEDAMTADWTRVPYDVLARISSRITNEVEDVNRVVLDITSKPPGTIEWE
jgi:GMP synthase (glutamine-hydrolysing)